MKSACGEQGRDGALWSRMCSFLDKTLTFARPLFQLQKNLGLTNLRGPKVLFFIPGVLLLKVSFTLELTTKSLEINFFLTGILLLNESLYWGFVVCHASLYNVHVGHRGKGVTSLPPSGPGCGLKRNYICFEMKSFQTIVRGWHS